MKHFQIRSMTRVVTNCHDSQPKIWTHLWKWEFFPWWTSEVLYSWYCDTTSSKVMGKEWSSCEESYQPLQLVLTNTALRLRLMMCTANCWISLGSNWRENCSTRHCTTLNQSRTTAVNCGIQSSVNLLPPGILVLGLAYLQRNPYQFVFTSSALACLHMLSLYSPSATC